MNPKNPHRMHFLVMSVAVLCGVAMLVEPATGRAQATTAPRGVVSANAPAAAQAEPYSYVFLDPLEGQRNRVNPDGTHQAIAMHGHWVIDVKNPDGTVVEHRDFENTLQTNGAAVLVALMAGYAVPADWEVFLTSTGTTPCTSSTSGSAYQGCVIVKSLTTNPGSTSCQYYLCAATLTQTFATSLTTEASNTITLTGQITANEAGAITSVQTYQSTCPTNPTTSTTLSTTSPSACEALTGQFGLNAISAATITQLNVVQSQIVQVTVVISFS